VAFTFRELKVVSIIIVIIIDRKNIFFIIFEIYQKIKLQQNW